MEGTKRGFTMEERWKSADFEPGRNADLPSYTVYCTDGELTMIK